MFDLFIMPSFTAFSQGFVLISAYNDVVVGPLLYSGLYRISILWDCKPKDRINTY